MYLNSTNVGMLGPDELIPMSLWVEDRRIARVESHEYSSSVLSETVKREIFHLQVVRSFILQL